MLTELLLFAGLVAAILALGVAIGMLVGGRLSRWVARNDEEPGDRADESDPAD